MSLFCVFNLKIIELSLGLCNWTDRANRTLLSDDSPDFYTFDNNDLIPFNISKKTQESYGNALSTRENPSKESQLAL
ncbi:hypothetical protein KIN20_003034, partial [Parelaphostrongylus tenuis]